MIKIKKVLLGLGLFTLSTSLTQAQIGYFEDALRFSRFNATGSARVMGLSGTQMSLGGDISNIHGNPAGLGFFQKSEFSITPSYTNWSNESNFLGQLQNDNIGNLSVPNISLVIASPRDPLTTGVFRGGTFGLSYNRMSLFNNEFGYFSEEQGQSSIIDFFLQQANGIPESRIENQGLTGLAYQTFLINPVFEDAGGNPISDPTEYDSFVLGQPFQEENIVQEGRISQTSASYGANLYNKMFIGAGVGLTSVAYTSTKFYAEEFFDEPLELITLDEFLTMDGFGVNLNLGVIYKPVEAVNLGLNFQSPTWYRINEQYNATLFSRYLNYFFIPEQITLGDEEASTPTVLSSYNLRTPMRISGGATFFIGKSGFISADVDYIDYSTNTISSNDFTAGADNQEIRRLYGQSINFRVGGEYRLDIWRLRGGYGYYGDPFVGGNFDRTTQQFSGGVGVRLRKFYVDFALINRQYDDLYRSYTFMEGGVDRSPTAAIRNNLTSGMLTVGFTF